MDNHFNLWYSESELLWGDCMQNETFRILLVDDDHNERDGLRFLIEREKYPLQIIEASNGKRALEIIRQEPIDILLADIRMPYMDGLELSAIVHDEFPETKIIIFSAYGEFEYAKKAMEAKAVNYLLKPIDVQEFLKVISSTMAKCREDKILAEQRKQRMQADKTLRWINLLTGKQSMTVETFDVLKKQGYPIGDKITLIHMETQGDFFSVSESEVMDCLTDYVQGRYVYVNMYPNSSYVVLFGDRSRVELQQVCEHLNTCAEETEIAFFVDDVPFDLNDLAQRVRKIEDIRRQMFIWNAETVFLSDLSELMDNGFSDVEMLWGQTTRAILSRNKTIILSHVNDLLDSMASHNLLSTAYIHHIFCDLLGKVYTEYGYSNNQRMLNAVHQLGRCRSKQELMVLISSAVDDVRQITARKQDVSAVVNKVKTLIRSRYNEDISLDLLADEVGFAPAYLSYVFKKETGENIIKFLTDYRMEKAKQLLDEGTLKIVQIAKQCGYDNQSYFNRLFKNAYGMTPKQYREKK